MHVDTDLLVHLRALEVELHQPAARSSPTRLAELIHDDFLEFGRSGAAYDKPEILRLLLSATQHAEVFSDNFAVRRLSTDVALLTYRAAHVQADGTLDRFTLRASIWQRVDGGWQISFHQGTATAAFAAGRGTPRRVCAGSGQRSPVIKLEPPMASQRLRGPRSADVQVDRRRRHTGVSFAATASLCQ
jgi:hypothetical protein